MKSSNRVLYFQWFGIGVLITIACVVFGLYLTQYLAKREARYHEDLIRKRERVLPGFIQARIKMMKTLVRLNRFSPEEAFEIIDHSQESPFPEASFLLDENGKVISGHYSDSFREDMPVTYQDFPLTNDRILRIGLVAGPRFGHERRGPPFGMHPPRHSSQGPHGPPRDVLLIVALAIGVSIIIGIGLSVGVLTFHLRKKAKAVSDLMSRIQAGDLSARFKITQVDEAGMLMVKFNEMADEIQNLVTNLRNTEESRKLLLQELAHDLRTPVASLRNLQETLFTHGNHLSPEEKDQLQSLSMKEVNYFERLVEDLLFLSGVNDPRYNQSSKEVDLTELMGEELELMSRQVKVENHLSSPLLVSGDEHLLRRLFRNALSNAGRFAQSKISVSSERVDSKIIIHIQDDGPGLSEKDLASYGEKKFSRQLQNSDSQHISLGLGSVIMKKIMTLHRGEMKIKNTHPGAEISFSFPA